MASIVSGNFSAERAGHPQFYGRETVDDLSPGDGGREYIDSVVRELTRELHADGIAIAWHGDNQPVRLATEGACVAMEPMQGDAVEAALRAGARQEWATSCSGTGPADDMTDHLTTGIPLDNGFITLTACFRRGGRQVLRRARVRGARLLPLLRPFFRMWRAGQRAMSQVSGLAAALDHSDVGVMLLNRRGDLLFVNQPAEALLARQDGLRRCGRSVAGGRIADTLRLQQAIEAAFEHYGTIRIDAASMVVTLRRNEGRPLLAAVVGSDEPASGEMSTAVILYVFDPDRDLRALIEPACHLYGLSPSETALTCLLADGVSLHDAAERLNLRDQSARSYLKQIFLKTDTSRQAELVWLMLKSAVRIRGRDLGDNRATPQMRVKKSAFRGSSR